jgi:hypothetical protein
MDEQNDLERLLSRGETERSEAEASQQRAASVGIALIPVGDLVWWQYVVIRPNVGKYGGGKDRLDIHGSTPQTAIEDVTRDAVLAGMAAQLGGRP